MLAEHRPDELTCHSRRVCEAAEPLVAAARAEGCLHADADAAGVVALTGAVATVAKEDVEVARRVLRLAVEGLRRVP